MSENTNQMPEVRQIRQVPVWSQDAEFSLTGGEFMALQNFFNIFAEPIATMQEVFKRHLDSGTIQVRYQDPQGTEIPKEEVDAYLKQMQEYFASQAQTVTAEAETEEAPKKLAKSKKTATVETETPA